jgi:hypothetical protein
VRVVVGRGHTLIGDLGKEEAGCGDQRGRELCQTQHWRGSQQPAVEAGRRYKVEQLSVRTHAACSEYSLTGAELCAKVKALTATKEQQVGCKLDWVVEEKGTPAGFKASAAAVVTLSILSDALLHLLVAIPCRCCCLQLWMLSLLMCMLVVRVGLQ